jgi:hypothetical protein
MGALAADPSGCAGRPRLLVRSKVDAATLALPIAKTGRLKTGRSADLLRFLVRHLRAVRLQGRGLGHVVFVILGGILHSAQVCQNSPAGTIETSGKTTLKPPCSV